ncbi:unnamed protein product [Brassica napus]|uniref:(rape) hypothetical protein n=1 Tax=Brassica napus TaxID=3708 RepID=A0A816SCR1_BRANA|nr:unnamed protein product [Brassica napus]
MFWFTRLPAYAEICDPLIHRYGRMDHYRPGSIVKVDRVAAASKLQLLEGKDLATAFLAVLGNEKASREIFNISGEKYVTFDGLARACAKAGGFPEPEIVHYNLKSSTLGRRRLSLSVTSISLPRWRKQSMFLDGNLDFGRGTFRKEADFTTDDMILSKKLVLL